METMLAFLPTIARHEASSTRSFSDSNVALSAMVQEKLSHRYVMLCYGKLSKEQSKERSKEHNAQSRDRKNVQSLSLIFCSSLDITLLTCTKKCVCNDCHNAVRVGGGY